MSIKVHTRAYGLFDYLTFKKEKKKAVFFSFCLEFILLIEVLLNFFSIYKTKKNCFFLISFLSFLNITDLEKKFV